MLDSNNGTQFGERLRARVRRHEPFDVRGIRRLPEPPPPLEPRPLAARRGPIADRGQRAAHFLLGLARRGLGEQTNGEVANVRNHLAKTNLEPPRCTRYLKNSIKR